MCCFNLRLFVPCLINIGKTFLVGILAWDWDPYNIIGNPSWMKVSVLLLLLTVFPFFSIETLLISTHPHQPRSVRLCLSGQYFSISMALSLPASLLFPQGLFWYAYPVILLPYFFCSSPRILNLLICLHAAASRLPSCSVLITATGIQPQFEAADSQVIDGRYPGEEGSSSGAGSEVGDLEANDVGDIF